MTGSGYLLTRGRGEAAAAGLSFRWASYCLLVFRRVHHLSQAEAPALRRPSMGPGGASANPSLTDTNEESRERSWELCVFFFLKDFVCLKIISFTLLTGFIPRVT